MSRKPALPVDIILPQITQAFSRHRNLVLEAPPGAGKTTRVPPALIASADSTRPAEVIVVEPRRIAARLASRRVAYEMGEEVGRTVGYQVRFEEAVGPQTRLRFVTEGVLTRRMLSDPSLANVSTVVLDEFHERHLEGDLALALLKRLQRRRDDLRIVVMSATLDSDPITCFLGDCARLRCEGKLFQLAIEHLPYSSASLEARVKSAVESLINSQHSGDILVFLPGAAEIRRCMRECEAVARRADLLMLPLHGALSAKEQERAIAPADRPKLIVATNVAESSVTIEGVTAVIDSGLARFADYSAWSGLPTLRVGRISKASAQQRAGRAGRTRPGRVLRLYSQEDYLRRPEQETPEVLRSDLSQLCLDLRAMRIDLNELNWLTSPPMTAIRAAESLLDRLGASGETAQKLARYPLPPRLSRILVEAMQRGVGEDGCLAAAVLGSDAQRKTNDLLAAMDAELDAMTRRHLEQLRRIARPPRQKQHSDAALLMSVLAGFPDRVARRRSGKQLLLSSGGSAEVAGEPPAYGFMVAIDAEERKEKPLPLVRMIARIEPEWLIDLFPQRVRERSEVIWNRAAERIEAISALLYDELVIQESRGTVRDAESATELLAQKALEVGIERFIDADALNELIARAEFAEVVPPAIEQALRDLCTGLRSFAELRAAATNFVAGLEQKLASQRLNEIAPARIRLPNGRQTKVHYQHGKPPWVAARLQDFFGMRQTPKIGAKGTPVVVHLLAPNHRALQTTTDLAGFWERLYPQVRRELMRRYPKHAWPERP